MKQYLKSLLEQCIDKRVFARVFNHDLTVEQDGFMVLQRFSQRRGMQ